MNKEAEQHLISQSSEEWVQRCNDDFNDREGEKQEVAYGLQEDCDGI